MNFAHELGDRYVAVWNEGLPSSAGRGSPSCGRLLVNACSCRRRRGL